MGTKINHIQGSFGKPVTDFTVIGIYGDNQQLWMAHIDKAASPKVAAKKAIKIIYADGKNGVELEDIFIVDVFKGYHTGTLCNDHVVSIKDLNKSK
jgi:hypothetical protein